MTDQWIEFATSLLWAVGTAVVISAFVFVALRLLARRWPVASELESAARLPFAILVGLVAVVEAVGNAWPTESGVVPGTVELTLRIATIAAAAWLIGSLILFVEDLGLKRYRIDVPDNKIARRLRTQVLVIRRLTVVAVVIIALGAMLLSFPGVRALGASLLASAGILSIIAGLAAQSTLGNVIAGIQIAFADSIRLDDAVIVENEWGWIEEITLTYVVVRLWDDRRLVLPSTYFTTTPFQNWTRNHSELLGSVEFDLDWRVSPDGMRTELDRILPLTDLWDGRAKVLQVTDAVDGWVRIRILVTARDAPTLFDLRCYVRERMIDWLQRENEAGLPRHRVESVKRASPHGAMADTGNIGLFSGDEDAEARAARVTGQLPVIHEELPER